MELQKPVWRWCASVAVLMLVACGEGVQPPEEQPVAATQEQAHRSADTGEIRWVRRSVGVGDETSTDVAVDRDGNTVVIGFYTGEASFDGHVLPAPPPLSNAQFMVKYAKDGGVRWARSFGASGPYAAFSSVAVDRHGRIVVVGSSGGELYPAGGSFLAQLSADGELLWSRGLGAVTATGIVQSGSQLAVDDKDNILLAGGMEGTLDFGGGPRAVPGPSPFIAKYTRSGRYLWDRVFSVTPGGHFDGVDTDSSGNIFVVGLVNGPIDLGGGTLTPPASGVGFVVAKFSSGGSHRWSKMPTPSSGSLRLSGITVQDNRVVVVGRLDGTMHFADEDLAAGGGLLLAYTRSGTERWSRTLSTGTLVDAGNDCRGDIAVLGFAFFDPGSDIDISGLPAGLPGYVFVAKYDAEKGERRWVRAIGWSAFFLTTPALAVARDGESSVAGSFTSPVYFGTTTLTPTVPGADDAFVMRLGR